MFWNNCHQSITKSHFYFQAFITILHITSLKDHETTNSFTFAISFDSIVQVVAQGATEGTLLAVVICGSSYIELLVAVRYQLLILSSGVDDAGNRVTLLRRPRLVIVSHDTQFLPSILSVVLFTSSKAIFKPGRVDLP